MALDRALVGGLTLLWALWALWLEPCAALAQRRCERGTGALRIEFEQDRFSTALADEVVRELRVSLALRHAELERGPRADGAAILLAREEEAGEVSIRVWCAADPPETERAALSFDPGALDEDVVAFALARAIDEVLQYAEIIAPLEIVETPSAERADVEAVEAVDPPVADAPDAEPDLTSEPAVAGGAVDARPIPEWRLYAAARIQIFSTEDVLLGAGLGVELEFDRFAIELEASAAGGLPRRAEHGQVVPSMFGATLAMLALPLDERLVWIGVGPAGSVYAAHFDATSADAATSERDQTSLAVLVGGRAGFGALVGPLALAASVDVQGVARGAAARASGDVVSAVDGVSVTICLSVGAAQR